MGKQKTIHYFQWLRAIAAVGIVLLHAVFTAHNVGAYQHSTVGELRDGLICIMCGRWCVPVFFMMSGALMLDPEREMGWEKLLRHAWRLVFVLLTFGFGFCLIESYLDYGGFSFEMVRDAFVNLLTGRSWDHLWFVYQLLGFYLVTPIIRPWVARASQREYRAVTLAVCFLLLGLHTLSSLLLGDGEFYYGFEVPRCFAYYLMGLYVHRHVDLDVRWWALGILSLVLTFVLWRMNCSWATDPNRIVVAPYAVLVFLVAKRYLDIPIEGHRVASLIADYSFGIYLIHPFFQHLFVWMPWFSKLSLGMPLTLISLGSLALSIPAIWLIRLIPGFKGKV